MMKQHTTEEREQTRVLQEVRTHAFGKSAECPRRGSSSVRVRAADEHGGTFPNPSQWVDNKAQWPPRGKTPSEFGVRWVAGLVLFLFHFGVSFVHVS